MKKLVLGLAVLGGLALGNGPVRAQCFQSEPGPYYTTPSWDQKFPGSQRFICLSDWNNQAVLDQETGLVWQRSPDRTKQDAAWAVALNGCHILGSSPNGPAVPTGGRLGWRLPSVEELASLLDLTQNNPALPLGHPFQGIQNDFYWTSTTDEANTMFAYGVFFGGFLSGEGGGIGAGVAKTATHFYWCVRGGASVTNPTSSPPPG